VLRCVLRLCASVVFGVTIPWMEHSVPGVLHVAVLTVTAGLGLIMYLCCVYCEPGRVPADWRPDAEAGGLLLELKRKGGELPGSGFSAQGSGFKVQGSGLGIMA
jgi:hypothetical protein